MITRGRDDLAGLVIGTLVTWRVSHLLVEEDGPGHLVTRLRRAVDATPLVGLLDCFGCASIWVGAAVSVAIRGGRTRAIDIALDGLAMSGAAFVLQKLTSMEESGSWMPEPQVDSPLITVQD